MDIMKPIDDLAWNVKTEDSVPNNAGNGLLYQWNREVIFLAPNSPTYDNVSVKLYDLDKSTWKHYGVLEFGEYKSGHFKLAGIHAIDPFWGSRAVISIFGASHFFKFNVQSKQITEEFQQNIELDGPPVSSHLGTSKKFGLLAIKKGTSDFYFLNLAEPADGYKFVDSVKLPGHKIVI